jgi:hypothetical protein
MRNRCRRVLAASTFVVLAFAAPRARAGGAPPAWPGERAPLDNAPVRIMGAGGKVLVAYQYRLVFLTLPKDVRLGTLGRGEGLRLLRGGTPVAPERLPATAVMTFKEPIEVVGTAYDEASSILVCTKPDGVYTATTPEEIAAFGREARRRNESGVYQDFCGVVGLKGNLIYRYPPQGKAADI